MGMRLPNVDSLANGSRCTWLHRMASARRVAARRNLAHVPGKPARGSRKHLGFRGQAHRLAAYDARHQLDVRHPGQLAASVDQVAAVSRDAAEPAVRLRNERQNFHDRRILPGSSSFTQMADTKR